MEIIYGELNLGVSERYSDEILVETSVDTSERGGAEKVLSVEAEVKLSSVELLDKEAEVSGKVNYRLLYLDRQSRLCGLDYFKDFKCRVKGDGITPNGRCKADFLVPDADARIKGEEVELSAVVEAILTYYGEETENAVANVTETETLAEEVVTQRVKVKERTIELVKAADGFAGVKKIVLFGTEVLPVEIKDGILSGEVRGTVLYLNDADEIAELSLPIPFEEAAEEGVCNVGASVKSARVILTDDEAGGALEAEVTLVLTETFCEDAALTVLTASCGEKSVVEEVFKEKSVARFVARGTFRENLSGSVPVEGTVKELFVRPGCRAIADVTVEDGSVKVEGVAAFHVVYGTEEGYRAERAELPFVFALPFAEARSGMTAEVGVKVADPVGNLRGKDVRITANVYLEVALFEKRSFRYLAEAAEGAPIPESDAGISVYFAEKGESLYAIARNMGVLPSVLVKANPFLAEPIEENRKILVFRQK